jgi:hypothetical protein
MKRQLSLIGIAALVLSLAGCPFKKKQPPVPQQGQAPTVQAPEPAPTPEPQPVETQPAPPAPEPEPEKAETTEKPKPKKPSPKKPAAPAQTQPPAQASATPPAPAPPKTTSKLVIQEGGAPNSQGQLAAGVGLEDPSSHNKQTTEQLLQSTQANLNSINRPLSPEEQAMVAQIKDYMAQAVKATKDSDTVRAHNLALKAHLLSDELVKH